MVQQQPKTKTRRTTTKHDKGKEPIRLLPKNENQGLYIDALKYSSQVVTLGPSGTGKTYISASHAASEYNLKNVNKVVITRPHVAVGRDIGHLPGSLEEKCAPWALPVIDVLERQLSKGVVETAIKNGNIETVPLALIRGRSFDDSIILVDEAQNLTTNELKALVTRVGQNSKLVINGDVQQTDLKEGDGLSKIVHLIKKYGLPIPIIEFTSDDIVRSDITKVWVETFMAEGI